MKNLKIKKVLLFLIGIPLMILCILFLFSVAVESLGGTNPSPGSDSQRCIKINNILLVRYNVKFDLIEESFSCIDHSKSIPWAGLPPNRTSYDEKYIQEMQSKFIGEKSDTIKIHRFKGIKRGYTEIIVAGTCNCDGKYRILIY